MDEIDKIKELFEGTPVFNTTIEGQMEYQIQHAILPSIFFDRPAFVANNICPEMLFDLYNKVYSDNNSQCQYKLEDFIVHRIAIDDNNFMACCELPKPKYTPLCYRIYFLFDAELKHLEYLTIEKGNSKNGGFLCGWDSMRNHHNYNKIENLEWDEKEKAIMLSLEHNIIAKMYMK